MKLEMKIPSPGESITEVEIATWLVKDGDYVERDDEIAEIDSDKATLTLNAEESGSITLKAAEGDVVKVGQVVCIIDTSAKAPAGKAAVKTTAQTGQAAPKKEAAPAKQEAPVAKETSAAAGLPSVAAKKIMEEAGISASQVNASGTGGRITKGDVISALENGTANAANIKEGNGSTVYGDRTSERKKMSMLRRKISQRLVSVKNETAMLTTFNEVDMSPIMNLRTKYKAKFQAKHGVGLGFMSFFTKAVTESLKDFPAVNAMIDGDELIYHNYMDVGIAVSTPKGLMVPIMRNAESMSMPQIESNIIELATKARDGKLSIDEMTGGTFTITNGGVFGSMLSTPILNPPQSAILGMHNIVERPVAINGKVEVRPIMYVALSYDHRIIDGKESVSFLVSVKKYLEDPIKLLIGSADPEKKLLGL